MKLSDFKRDSDREVQGVWEECADGLRLKVARAGNPRFRAALDQLLTKYQRRLDVGRESNIEVTRRLQAEASVGTILLDWEGLKGDDGRTMPFTHENALQAMRVPAFADLVAQLASDPSRFEEPGQEEAEGNSLAASIGSSPTANTPNS